MLSLKLFIVFFLPFVSFLALADCGTHPDDYAYNDLIWNEVAIYRVNSPYADVHGVMCAGVRDGRMLRAHYRDNQGVKVYKSLDQLKERDIVFFAHADFPRAARWVMRSEDPLTIKVTSERITDEGDHVYQFSAKFLRNPRKGFYAPDIREIALVYQAGSNITVYKDQRLDEISLNISGALNINQVVFKEAGATTLTINPFDLPRAQRF